MSLLMETANPSQGRLRGRTDARLVTDGTDRFYVAAAKLGRLYVPFDDTGHPLTERVGRHLTSLLAVFRAMGDLNEEQRIVVEGVPTLPDVKENGIGAYLNPLS